MVFIPTFAVQGNIDVMIANRSKNNSEQRGDVFGYVFTEDLDTAERFRRSCNEKQLYGTRLDVGKPLKVSLFTFMLMRLMFEYYLFY